MDSKKKSKMKNNYFEEIKQYQDHQYDPGYYTGGNIPPYIKYPSKPFIRGLLYIIGGIIIIFLLIYLAFTYFDINDIVGWILSAILYGGVCIIYILAGYRLIKKARLMKKQVEKKRRNKNSKE